MSTAPVTDHLSLGDAEGPVSCLDLIAFVSDWWRLSMTRKHFVPVIRDAKPLNGTVTGDCTPHGRS